jgi:CPA1 family monovalent cation:H+ antiporter
MPALRLDYLELVLLILLVAVAVLALVAKRLGVAYPIMLVIGGVFLGLLPRVPHISMDPDVVFLVILPPLVFSAAFHTSWRDFRDNLIGIVMLAFGLVGFTIFGVAGAATLLIPGFPWKLGLVLGSVVAATDAIAATATAKRLGLPRRITDLLEAESLVNDGSGLVALRFTLAMVVTGVTPSVLTGTGTLLYLVFAALAVGLLAGVVVHQIQKLIAEPPVEITISLITPYIAYLAAERLQCSGVLATLACGLYLGRRSSGFFSLHARIESSAVWRTLDFVLNGLVFLVLGLQLPSILANLEGTRISSVFLDGALISGVVILLRLLWVYPGEWISWRIQRQVARRESPRVSRKEVFLVGWAGMRGVLALAAAFSLPEKLGNGLPFPFRNLIIFLTFCVIFATLVLQGLSMPALIRALGLSGRSVHIKNEELEARKQMVCAALDALQNLRVQYTGPDCEVLDHMEAYYKRRLALDSDPAEEAEDSSRTKLEMQRYVAQELRNVERSTALELRDSNQIHDEVLRRLEYELDLLDARFADSD